MQSNQEVFLFGDTHGGWGKFNGYLNGIRQKNEKKFNGKEIIIIICGDFGYWPSFKENDIKNIKHECSWAQDGFFKIYFCPGNHEDWWALQRLEDEHQNEKIIELRENIFYCSFGAVKSFKDMNFLFVGGADSVDKQYRTLGIDWFPEEVISHKDILKLPESEKIDIVISHTCPTFIIPHLARDLTWVKSTDPSCKALTYVYDLYKPTQWFFGHFHTYKEVIIQNCRFICLADTYGIKKCIHLI